MNRLNAKAPAATVRLLSFSRQTVDRETVTKKAFSSALLCSALLCSPKRCYLPTSHILAGFEALTEVQGV